jgi:hypothetical protein
LLHGGNAGEQGLLAGISKMAMKRRIAMAASLESDAAF